MSYSITVNHVNAPAVPRGAEFVAALYDAFRSFMTAPVHRPSRMEEAAAVRELARQAAPITETDLRNLHRLVMLRSEPEIAGRYALLIRLTAP